MAGPQLLSFDERLARILGNKRAIKASQLEQTTVREGDDVTLYREQRPDDKVRWWGHGWPSQEQGETAHKYFDAVASGNGTGNVGDQLVGDFLVVIADSEGRVIYEMDFGDSQTLADAQAEPRTDRPTQKAVGPGVNQGQYMEVRFNADAASDGVEYDPSASSGRAWYSQISA